MSARYFYRYMPGADAFAVPANDDLLGSTPHYFRLGYDVGRAEVRAAVLRTLALVKTGLDVRLFMPFYASRFVPYQHHRFISEGPGRYGLKHCSAGVDAELASLARDATGHYYPAVINVAREFVANRVAPVPALAEAYRRWAPGVLQVLWQFADRKTLLGDYQLVRDWERVQAVALPTEYYRTGREAMEFLVNFGALKREGAGRLRWGPLYKNVFLYLTTK